MGRLVQRMAVSSSARDQSAVVTLVKVGSGEEAPWRRVGMRMMEMTQMLGIFFCFGQPSPAYDNSIKDPSLRVE